MNRSYDFKEGASVRRQYPNDEEPHSGSVLEVTLEGIWCDWNDLDEPTFHPREEYEYITVI